jgi:hypothetical protein
MQLTPERIREISLLANSLWSDFAEIMGADFRHEKLFDPKGFVHPNRIVRSFFRFCAKVYSKFGDEEVEPNIIFDDLSESSEHGQPAASWLMSLRDSKGVDCPTIVIDSARLNSTLSTYDGLRMMSQLALHEIGHLVLHWDELRTPVGSDGNAVAAPAKSLHEAEAWWFCYSIIGLVVAECAYQNKCVVGNADDRMWTFVHR